MAFIFLRTDAFLNNLRLGKQNKGKDLIDGKMDLPNQRRPIRRPYRGIQIKEDRYSTISVLMPGNRAVPLISSSDTSGGAKSGKQGSVQEYADYILQAINEQRAEKQQILETFGDPYVYFFGERPRILEVQGLLINTEDFNWKSQFWRNYDQYLRGTKLVQRNARVYLSWDTNIVEGYILQASASERSEEPYSVPFSFSMLLTGYYDWSDIGQTRFPGYSQNMESLDVLNRDLENRRSQFTSTASDVRLANLLKQPASGFGAFVKSTIKDINSVISTASSLVDKIGNVVGGRTVRVPVGVAGFLQSVGAAQIGASSISTDSVTAQTLGKQFDAATGKYEGLNGSVKLRMPGTAMFAREWISEITNQRRGFIFENIDEYPTEAGPETLRQILSESERVRFHGLYLDRKSAIEENAKRLAMQNQIAEAGGILGDLADAVSFAKGAFGLAMSALSFARDPLGSLKATLGISEIGGDVSSARIEGRKDQLKASGIETSYKDKSFLSKVGNFIGGSAIRTFEGVATAEVEDPQPASLGQVYSGSAYQQPLESAEGLSYEPAYGDENFKALTDADPETQGTLDEVYGNTDEDSEVDPASLLDVYGAGNSSPAVRTPAEIAAILAAIQSSVSYETDEDRTGIRGVDDDDAPIDPII